MAKRRRKRAMKNPQSLSPRLVEHIVDLTNKAQNVQDKAYKLSSHTGGALSKILNKFGDVIGDTIEEIEDEAGIID